jgi:hypothetical protein
MARTLTAGMATAIAADHGVLAHLFELVLYNVGTGTTVTVRYTTAPYDLTFGGNVYTAVGGALTFDTITESGDLAAGGTQVTLSGVDQALLAVLLQYRYVGQPIRIYYGHLDLTTCQLVVDPVLAFDGFMNGGWTVKEKRPTGGASPTPGSVTITGQVASALSLLDETRGIQTNVVAHQSYYPGDTFFQYVDQLSFLPITWNR